VVESPETDRQFDAAKSDADNKSLIAQRYKPLLEKKLVSQQEADQAFSDSDIAASRLGQLKVMKDYEQLRAPFDGVVTARYADPGALMQNAETGSTGALPVFTVAKTDRLRVTFYVDQKDAPFVRPGTPCQGIPVRAPRGQRECLGDPDRRVPGRPARARCWRRSSSTTAGALRGRRLRSSGARRQSYAAVGDSRRGRRHARRQDDGAGDRRGRISYRAVVIGDDERPLREVVSGLNPGDQVGLNLGNSVNDWRCRGDRPG